MSRLEAPEIEAGKELVLAAKDAVLYMVELCRVFGKNSQTSKTITRLNNAIKDFESASDRLTMPEGEPHGL